MDERAETDMAIRRFFKRIAFNFMWWRRRVWMRLFHPKLCLKITFHDYYVEKGDVYLTADGKELVYMGKDWFALIQDQDV